MMLHEYITKHLHVPFKWGENDCLSFALRWVEISTGKTPFDGLPKWKTAFGAKKVIKKFKSLEAILDARFERVNPNLAQDGDIALVNGAVTLLSGAYCTAPGEKGLEFVDRMEATCAWRC